MQVITTEKLPIKIWTLGEIDPDDENVIRQFRNLANHPLAVKWVCGMVDFHYGYGMPIGGVMATQGGVIPYAVGLDIGCGMIAAETTLEAARWNREQYLDLRRNIHALVPVGQKHRDTPQESLLLRSMEQGPVVAGQWERAQYQLGTLGGGNHFIELQAAQDGRLWIMLHSGSRNIGKRVCDHYHKIAKRYMRDFASAIPDPELSFLPRSVPEHDMYLTEMRWCMAFAEASRQRLLQDVLTVLTDAAGTVGIERLVDTHHNFAVMENHFGQNVMIHRKGAVKAKGLVTLPGSMQTASYICEGLEPTESFNTCSHGAGRTMGRKAANRLMVGRHEEAVAMMAHVAFGVREGQYDELGFCYKDIDAVIEAQSDLIRPVVRLEPLAVVKG